MKPSTTGIAICTDFLEDSATEQPTAVIVDSVDDLDDVSADYNTAFEDLVLPTTAPTNLDNATQQDFPVNWQIGSYDPAVSGPCTIYGILDLPEDIGNPAGVLASVTVNVAEQVLNIEDLEDFSDVEAEQGTDFENLGLPAVVEATMSDGPNQLFPIVWDQGDFDSLTPGTYNIQGTITITDPNVTNLSNLQPSINIVITAITPVDRQIVSAASQSAITVPYGTAFGSVPLPSQVAATLDDSSVVNIDSQWQQGSYSSNTPGTYNLQANFVNLPANVKNDNAVHPAKSVQVLSPAGTEDGVHVKKIINTIGNALGFWQWLPEGYSQDTSKTYPLLIFLHGAGERGLGTDADLNKVTNNGPPKHIKNGNKMVFTNPVTGLQEKFIVLSPQTNSWIWYNQGQVFLKWILDSGLYRVNLNKVYMTGLSMGGHGAWENLAVNANTPNLLAAIGPICPGATPNWERGNICFTKGIKAWAFHCVNDSTAAVYGTQRPINEIKTHTTVKESYASNAAANFEDYVVSYYPDAAAPGVDLHFTAWDRAYRVDHTVHNPNLYEWLLTKSKA